MSQKHQFIGKSKSQKEQETGNRRANVSILNTCDYESSQNLVCDEVKIEEEKAQALTANFPNHHG